MTAAVALSIGGSTWQVDIIRKAKEMGLRTLVADISAEAPGRRFADQFYQIDTNDKEAILRIARVHQVTAILAEQSDRTVPIAGYLNQHLGLPGIRETVAWHFTNKLAMRNILRDSGVPMPRYAEVRCAEEAVAKAESWGYPSVLKPKSSQASLGVFKVENRKEIDQYFDTALEHSRDGALLVEEFITGTEITVEGISLEGKFHLLAISEKEHYPFNACVARRLSYPPRMSDEILTRARLTAEKAVTTLGLQDGLSHGEYRVRNGVPYLIEVAARGGGNRIASVIAPHVSGVDVYALLIRRLLGETVAMPEHQHRAAVLFFFDFASGRVKTIRGQDQVREEKLAHELVLQIKPGDEIRSAADDRTRPGYALVLGNTRDEVDARVKRIQTLVQIDYDTESRAA
jgi:carbamoyl-phosphate synthase large subunit